MSRAERAANLAGVVVPFVGVLVAVYLMWNRWVEGVDLALLVASTC
jgi:stearoyl-CoA desaturase (delta-9 desaturase)